MQYLKHSQKKLLTITAPLTCIVLIPVIYAVSLLIACRNCVIKVAQIFTFYLLDGFVPLGKDDFDKAHEANVDVLNKAIDEVVAKQLDLGVDIVNDGELPRENYFLHFVRKIERMTIILHP